MPLRRACTVAIAATMLPVWSSPAVAFITRLVPLKDVVRSEQMIFVARVERIDPSKPAVVFRVDEVLKGKPSFERLPINFTGDTEATKHDHPAQLLKRLRLGLPVLVFGSTRGQRISAFVFTDGTWFHVVGTKDGDAIRWGLTHGEPYLRRTFKGSTAELQQIVIDALAGKKEPPAPNGKEPPGFGPEIAKEPPLAAVRPSIRIPPPEPVAAVVPTFVLVGPLALLAAAFPAVFGGLALLLKRWLAFLSVSSLVSTVYLLARWGYLPGQWLRRPLNLWLVLAGLSAVGAVWAAVRYRKRVRAGSAADFQPGRGDRLALAGAAILAIGALIVLVCLGEPILDPPGRDMLLLAGCAAIGTAYVFRAVRPSEIVSLSAETVLLWGLVFGCTTFAALEAGRAATAGGGLATASDSRVSVRVAWTFDASERGSVVAAPVLDGNRVFVACALNPSPSSRFGRLSVVQLPPFGTPGTLRVKPIREFDDDEGMKSASCAPCVADGQVFIGEGTHEDGGCRLFALDADSLKKRPSFAASGAFATGSHTESVPIVGAGRIYFGAGDDGVYALDSATGAGAWNFRGPHVDAALALADGKVYGGGGQSRKVRQGEVFCLDAANGKPLWRLPVAHSAWGAPTVAGGRVFVGTGTGKMTGESDPNPAGALLCLDAATGHKLWECPVADGVLTRPAVDAVSVYFGSRDGSVYAADRTDGRLIWKRPLGSPVVSAPAVARLNGHSREVYAASSAGRVCALDPATGRVLWEFSVTHYAAAVKAEVIAPVVVRPEPGEPERRLILVAATVFDSTGATARLYGLEETISGE